MKNIFESEPEFARRHDILGCSVNGKPMYYTEDRIADADMPSGWHKAEVRGKDRDWTIWSTIEPSVWVNHAATLISDEPFVFAADKGADGEEKPYTPITSYERETDLDDYGELLEYPQILMESSDGSRVGKAEIALIEKFSEREPQYRDLPDIGYFAARVFCSPENAQTLIGLLNNENASHTWVLGEPDEIYVDVD